MLFLTPLSIGLRNNKEFRAYDLKPGHPIRGPNKYDLDVALNALATDDNGNEDGHDIDSESECSELSDLTDLDDNDEPFICTSPPSSSPWKSCLSSFFAPIFRPFQTPPGVEESDTEAEDIPLCDSSEHPEKGKKARRKWKKMRNNEKRRQRRRLEQEALGTRLKSIARCRAAESHKLDARETFISEDLPVNSGGWSGLHQQFEKINPGIAELLGDEYNMQLVSWNGKDSYAIVNREGRVIAVLAGMPRNGKWDSFMKELEEAIGKARENMSFSKKQKEQVQGDFPAIAASNHISLGNNPRSDVINKGNCSSTQI
ncbi:hypothetical protein BT96DRAFT_1005588 [Gymnopus androsaceus JB14]|uniref:Uncharacterized protein n=1 Tax=Gymnopus androsaceus JB14 TaxID=1447944 RepID=A0A6A4GNP9_9AGAR|nr:hypothetical protein BT96DRAFT_1005588 [Gymnopus androsaceus JB14]